MKTRKPTNQKTPIGIIIIIIVLAYLTSPSIVSTTIALGIVAVGYGVFQLVRYFRGRNKG